MSHALGRREPTDWKHVDKYPLTADTTPTVPTAVVLGVNWYSGFDTPVLAGGRYWIKRTDLGTIRGGHAVCIKPAYRTDPLGWWDFYNQGREGSCVGFACSRLSSLHNRTRYAARWLYQEAQKIDEWPGESYDGTSVRAGFEMLRSRGHRTLLNNVTGEEKPAAGISEYRWATSVEQVHASIQMPLAITLGAIPLLNSWGRDYPHITWMPDEVLARLLAEDGEAGLVTDRP